MAIIDYPTPTLRLELATPQLFATLRGTWTAEVVKYGEEEYAVAQIQHAEELVVDEDRAKPIRPNGRYGIYILTDDAANCHGLAHFNRAQLPATEGWTLRVVWILLAPRYDYEEITDELAAQLIGGFVYGALQLCAKGDLKSDHLKIHLQNQSDRRLAAYLVQNLEKSAVRTKVSVRGNWLHIDYVGQ